MATHPGQAAPYLFLSYASVDRDRTLRIADVLETNGISVWIDRQSIAGGTSWSAEIVRGIRGCTVFAVVSSPAAMLSPNVQQEIQVAFESRRPILPLLLEPVDLPEAVVYALAGRQWIEVLDRADDLWLPQALRALGGMGLVAERMAPTPGSATAATVGVDTPAAIPPRTNLPAQLTSFIGREREVTEIESLLRDPTTPRLLTLTGTGGCGKTRLALQIAASVGSDFPDGVWLVELASLADPDLVTQSVAAVVGVQEQAGRSLLTTLIGALAQRRLLLVFDNCEHLLDSCAHLIDSLLRGCPTVRVVATSREIMGIAGEVSRRVPSLEAPSEQAIAVEYLIKNEAVRLFVERARVVQPEFAVSEQNAASVAKICRRLDGIPLAIELAAARLRAFSVEQVATRLDQRFRFLTGGSRAALPRQQTLAALVGWSYDLLGEPQRMLFNRLSVFAGGWTLEAAEAVGGDDALSREDVPDLLAQLVDKSLVILELPADGNQIRYRLLETLRQYGREKLVAAGEADVIRGRHLSWYLEFTEQAGVALLGPEQATWLDRLETELDNLRTALAWSQEPGAAAAVVETGSGPTTSVEAGLRLAGALLWFWFERVHRQEGWRWLKDGLTLGRDITPNTRARALMVGGFLDRAGARIDPDRLAMLEERLNVYRHLGDNRGLALAASMLAFALDQQSDAARVRKLAEEGIARARASGDDQVLVQTLFMTGYRAGVLDDERREAGAKESLELARQSGNTFGISFSDRILGDIALRRGQYDRARQSFLEDLKGTKLLREPVGIIIVMENLGDVSIHLADYQSARAYYDEAHRLCDEIGWANSDTDSHISRRLGRLAVLQGDLARGRELVERALTINLLGQDQSDSARCLTILADIAERQGKLERVARLLAAAQPVRAVGEAPWERAECERLAAAARGGLPEALFAAAWAEGEAMTLEQAVAYALDEESVL